MAVTITFSETLNGAAIADSLQGTGAPTGLDMGNVVNGEYAPITLKAANTGKQDIYARHDATLDPITNCVLFIQQYGTTTGNAYGGQRTAAGDYSALVTLGQNSGSSKNNADGLSGGLWLDMDWDALVANQFDQANFPTNVKIFGDGGTDGVDLASGFTLSTAAMVYDSGGETSASSPVAGQIGKATDGVLGDNAHLKTRIYLPTAHADGGYYQVEFALAYRYTA